MTHEVYIASYKGDVLYIGEGKVGRSEHVKSGISNIYTLNKLHFSGEVVDVEVIPCETKEQSKRLEKELIQSLQPLYNTEHSTLEQQMKVMRRELKLFDLEHGDNLSSNVTYGVVKAAVKNASNKMTTIITPTYVIIACPRLHKKNTCAGAYKRFHDNPTSKLSWYIKEFERGDSNGIYNLKLVEDLLEQGTLTARLRKTFKV